MIKPVPKALELCHDVKRIDLGRVSILIMPKLNVI